MRYVCPECGSQIPDDSDFCHVCGCLKSKAYAFDDDMSSGQGTCPRCGSETRPGEMFCERCGAPLRVQSPFRFSKRNATAMLLALIPGFFSIYGLGHLVLKEWIRGVMFLAMTALYWYMRLASGTNGLILIFLSVALYIYQMSDLFRVMVLRGFGNERLDREIPSSHARRSRRESFRRQYPEGMGQELVVRSAGEARRGADGVPGNR